MAHWVQILGEAVYISYNTNTLGKGMNPTILPPSYGWLVWFYGISTIVGYLTPNPFFYK